MISTVELLPNGRSSHFSLNFWQFLVVLFIFQKFKGRNGIKEFFPYRCTGTFLLMSGHNMNSILMGIRSLEEVRKDLSHRWN